MSTYEENMQTVLDMRAIVLNPDLPDPEPADIYKAVQALHSTRGAVAAKKTVSKPIINLADIFAKKPEEDKPDASGA